MKKPYMPKLALFSILSIWSISQSVAQTLPEFQPFAYTHIYSWDTSPYQSFQYPIPSSTIMRFRLALPNGFDRFANDGNKYPIIIFLHGSGEAGVYDAAPNNGVGEQDNEKQLVHGGQTHLNAVRNGTFPGLLLYPQVRRPNPESGNGPAWGFEGLKAVEYILRKLIQSYKVDPNRIYIHGLSMGGEGAWRFIAWRPDLFAAAHPMSAAGTAFWKNSSSPGGYWSGEARARYVHIPIRLSQGALDTGPAPGAGNDQVDAIREIGGNIRYDYYPTLGHGTWNSEYAKPDFFSWFLAQKKYNITVGYGQTSFCPGENFSVIMGLTPGFASYQWAKNGVTFLTSATGNQITVTQAVSASSGPGIYTARFQRSNGEWTPWSDPVDINSNRSLSPTPVIAADGQSRHLPALDGSPDISLSGSIGKAAYIWKRGGTTLANTTQTIGVSTAGAYTLASRDFGGTGREANGITPTEFRATPLGCQSLPSEPINVTTAGSLNIPAPPSNVIAGATSSTAVALTFDDRSTDETGFELYRSTSSTGGYKLIIVLPATTGTNPQTYNDINLAANTTYYYRMRAVNNNGGSAYSPATSVKTVVDNLAPTAPVLTVGGTTRSEINLSWTGSTDNVGVTDYDLYQNGNLITSTKSTRYKVTGLTAFANYSFVVKARDLSNNVSAPSNQANAAAIVNGLTFDYYHHNGIPNIANIPAATYIKSGTSAQFNLTQRNQEDNFAFVFNGFINIPTSGTYTFYTSSDDGSNLWVNGVRVVNNDNTHNCQERSGNITLSAGTYPIQCNMFANGGAECLTVRWQGPGIAKTEIPENALKDTNATPPAALIAPTGFSATPSSFNQINLAWADNSSNETGFEIERSLAAESGYQVVNVAPADATSWSDNTLAPSTQYFYRVRAINLTSASPSVGPADGSTSAPPPAPTAPSGLSGIVNSPTQVTLSWADNSSGESGFEIQKSSQPGNGFVTIGTAAADATSYIDATANGHSALYYRIRAVGYGGVASAYTSEVNLTTGNRAPTITAIIDRNIRIGSNLTFDILANDPDVEPLTFSFPNGLPAFASFQNNGYGKGKLTFTGAVAGTYNIRAQVSDGVNAVFDDFVLVVNTNNAPVLADIPFQSTEEGRTAALVVAATDADGDALTYSVSGLPSFCTWSASQRRITARPVSGQAGVYENITVTVRDNKVPAGVDTKTFTLIVTALDQAYTISVNFATTPSMYEGAPWNNTGMPQVAAHTNLKDDQGNVVRFVSLLTTTSWTTIAPQVVDLPVGANPIYTEKVRESYYRRSSGGTGNKMKLNGLNPTMLYKVTLYGAGGWAGTTPPAVLTKLVTRYTVAGLTTEVLELNTLNNISNTVTTGLMKPTSGGEISITVARGTDNINNFYINAMVLSAFYDNGSAPDAPSNLVATAVASNRVNLTWTDNSLNEQQFDILRSTTLDGVYAIVGSTGANATAYTDNTTIGRTSYYYKVRASGLTNGSDTSPQLVTTPNGIPTITTFDAIVGISGQTFQRTISATDPDGDAITFSTLGLPSFATLIDNGNGTGYIQFTPTSAQAGTYNFEVHAADNFEGVSGLAATVIATDADYSEIVYLNFKSDPGAGDAPAPWNNLLPFNAATGIRNVRGQNTSIQVRPRANWTGSSNTDGVNSSTGIYPAAVLASHWTTTSTTGAVLTLKGLDNTKRYNLALSGSLNQFWFANTTYIVNGTQKTLNTSKNTDRFVKFSGIQPAGDSIVITVRKGATVNAAPLVTQRDGILGSLVIETVTPGANPARPTNFVANGASKTSVRLSWTDNSADETGFEIYRATTQGGTFSLIQTTAANAESFTNTGLSQNTAYIYRVRAIKSGGASSYTNDVYARTFNQVILVNVNSSAGSGQLQAPAPWNNLATPPSDAISFSNFKDDTNANTAVGMNLISWENGGTNNTGFLTGNNSGVYPDAVLENYYYYEQFDPATTYQLTGLNNNQHYDLLFLGNEWNVATTGNMIVATDYTVDGVTVSQFNGKNSTETVGVKQVQPESGIIPFEIKGNDDARYGVWNSLEVRSYTPIGSTFDIDAPSIPQNLVASSITTNSVQLTWAASTDNVGVTGYRIYQNTGTLVKTVTTLTTSMTGLSNSTTYVFYVKSIDAAGNESASSKGVRITTNAPGGREAVSADVLAEEPALLDADVFPNPAREKVTVKFGEAVAIDAPVNIIIYTVQGTVVSQLADKNRPEGIEISTLNYRNGVYLMRINVNGRHLLKKFFRE